MTSRLSTLILYSVLEIVLDRASKLQLTLSPKGRDTATSNHPPKRDEREEQWRMRGDAADAK